MTKELAQAAILEYFKALSALDCASWVQCFATDAVVIDPIGSPAVTGHTALRQYFFDVANAFEKLSITADNLYTCGSQTAVKWSCNALGKNGRTVTFDGIDLIEVDENGKIQRLMGYWDPASMMGKLLDG